MTAIAPPSRSTGAPRIPISLHRWVTIRPIESSDADGLFAFYGGLSARARYARFLGICPGIDAATAQNFATVDHTTREGLVAVMHCAGPDDGAIVGHACLEADGRGVEEVAFAVADDLQGRSIGSALMHEAIRSARQRGIHQLTGTTFAQNTAMRRLVYSAGPPFTVSAQPPGLEEFRLDIAA